MSHRRSDKLSQAPDTFSAYTRVVLASTPDLETRSSLSAADTTSILEISLYSLKVSCPSRGSRTCAPLARTGLKFIATALHYVSHYYIAPCCGRLKDKARKTRDKDVSAVQIAAVKGRTSSSTFRSTFFVFFPSKAAQDKKIHRASYRRGGDARDRSRPRFFTRTSPRRWFGVVKAEYPETRVTSFFGKLQK